ncbi:LysR family transcriptional regulator [Brevibacillus dissolubilis]|uniref:LysR family transcriptional regulator n=1 Tax=Brevibacillus dissolubilis TaxID=1844116 RepID=UPI00111748BD|nr:LysR family transcriptional regulator [Brevibacillus dissolubilis]
MEIRQLITFRTIVDVGSYTNAAIKLGYTQSTITSHIKGLEAEIGGELFTYIKRELNLTSLGKELIPLADELLYTYNRITQLNSHDKVRGELKIAAPESLTITRLGPILREYSSRYPDVKIILSNGTCGQNQKDLMSGHVDLAFMVWPEFQIDTCTHHVLHQEEIVIITSPNKTQHFDDYKYKTTTDFFITNEEGCSYRSMFETHLTHHKLPKFQTMELWSLEAIKQAVMSGLGFAVLPYITVKNEVEQGLVKIMEHNESFEPIYSHLLVKSKKWHAPAVEKFIELTLEAV